MVREKAKTSQQVGLIRIAPMTMHRRVISWMQATDGLPQSATHHLWNMMQPFCVPVSMRKRYIRPREGRLSPFLRIAVGWILILDAKSSIDPVWIVAANRVVIRGAIAVTLLLGKVPIVPMVDKSSSASVGRLRIKPAATPTAIQAACGDGLSPYGSVSEMRSLPTYPDRLIPPFSSIGSRLI
jgi:hypothetical protein